MKLSCEQMAKNVAEKALDDYFYEGKSIREWIKIIAEQEPKTGRWITHIKSDRCDDSWPTNPKCSECGGEPYYNNTIYSYKFCPFCGAKMSEV